jgi:hypothetical protein
MAFVPNRIKINQSFKILKVCTINVSPECIRSLVILKLVYIQLLRATATSSMYHCGALPAQANLIPAKAEPQCYGCLALRTRSGVHTTPNSINYRYIIDTSLTDP